MASVSQTSEILAATLEFVLKSICISISEIDKFYTGRIGIPHESNHSFTTVLQGQTPNAIAAIAFRPDNVC